MNGNHVTTHNSLEDNTAIKNRMGLRVVRRELHRLVGELRREVGEVPLALEPRPVRRRDLLLLELKERHTGGTDFNFDTQIMENTASYHILIKSKTVQWE